ncbi:MAG: lamin tail domain-containing protein [Prevotellaceae bacterium]|jgi:Na+-transporting methylmalonyl-CoA/oxaloacetate decarboxylase gamma subunit|nr:lamin tail domain-containing protein [Prevotellaceae bacterium]
MRIFKRGLNLFLFMTAVICVQAQVTKLQINEIMVNNQGDYVDHYGQNSPWIEIYNNSGASTNIGGCFLSDDLNNPRKYPITKGDKNTIIGPRQFTIFWADNNATRGTFHVNFRLDPAKENTVYLSDASGKLIDKLIVPAKESALVDKSYGRKTDGSQELGVLAKPTPNINNAFADRDAANEKFKENDPTGIAMSVTAVAVVFLALILLYVCFKYTGRFYINRGHKKAVAAAEAKGGTVDQSKIGDTDGIPVEVCAAIAAALYEMQNDIHDIEDAVLTIEKKAVSYSPWSSKIYGLRQTPQVNTKR